MPAADAAAAARDALLAAPPGRRAFVHDARVCAECGQEPGIALLQQRLGRGVVPEAVLPARVPARARVAPAPVEAPQAAALALLPLLLPLQRAQAVQEHLRMRARPRSVRHPSGAAASGPLGRAYQAGGAAGVRQRPAPLGRWRCPCLPMPAPRSCTMHGIHSPEGGTQAPAMVPSIDTHAMPRYKHM